MLDFETVFQAVNAIGTVGVLIFFVYAFYKGHIISKPVMDDIVAATVVRVLDELDARYDHGPKRAK